MQKSEIAKGKILLSILFLIILAIGFSLFEETMYIKDMNRDIQSFTQELTQTGMAPAQIQVFRSVLLDVKQNTFNYVSCVVLILIICFSNIGIILMNFSHTIVGKIAEQEKENT
jgi:hypothetical protein